MEGGFTHFGVMTGRGHLAGPCPALSYVERAISVLEYFFFFQKKKNLKFRNPIFLIFVSPSFPLNFPSLSIYPKIFPPSTTTHYPPPFGAPSFFQFRRPVSHEPATVVLHLRPLGTARRHLRRPIPNHRQSSSSGPLPSPTVF